jgi:methyl-accepting chemotaxis protein
MTPDQAILVWHTFEAMNPPRIRFAERFYAILFQLDPSLRRLFSDDMTEQNEKLVEMIGTAVGSLDRLPELLPKLRELGRRHVLYGVRLDHYPLVGAALIAALRQELGPAFDAAAQAAWVTAYGVLSQSMLDGARDA